MIVDTTRPIIFVGLGLMKEESEVLQLLMIF